MFAGVCTANSMDAKMLTKSYVLPDVPDNVFLLEAAASYLDVFGVLPGWTPGKK